MGRSYEEIYGKEGAEAQRRKLSLSRRGKPFRYLSEESRVKHSLHQREAILRRYAQGWRPKAGRCAKVLYVSPSAGQIFLDGSWELLTARYLDHLGILWSRPSQRFPYLGSRGRICHYTPDFFLTEAETYIEVKGYITDLDRLKWSQFSRPLEIYGEERIHQISEMMNISLYQLLLEVKQQAGIGVRCKLCGKRISNKTKGRVCLSCIIAGAKTHRYERRQRALNQPPRPPKKEKVRKPGNWSTGPKLRISKEALSDIVWKEPLSKIGPSLGVTGSAVKKLCKKYAIKVPGRGYWAKIYQKLPLIDLVCSCCGKAFKRIRQRVPQSGRKSGRKVYCSQACSGRRRP